MPPPSPCTSLHRERPPGCAVCRRTEAAAKRGRRRAFGAPWVGSELIALAGDRGTDGNGLAEKVERFWNCRSVRRVPRRFRARWDIEGPEATSPDDVKFTLELEIGTKEESWTESFSVLVVTPNNRPGRTPHTRFLALPRYSHAVLKGHLVKALAASQRDSWEESLLELRKRFFWEWEST
ncbi:hypothetical protein B9J07_08805 [Sinorhizobium sp. LM21]|nr:hypothetical protein B9J07_08805 [Sinorhizobium sp. LM21]